MPNAYVGGVLGNPHRRKEETFGATSPFSTSKPLILPFLGPNGGNLLYDPLFPLRKFMLFEQVRS